MELGEGVLKVNLGMPLIIICTKSDAIQNNEKAMFNEQALDVLTRHIRTSALLCMKPS